MSTRAYPSSRPRLTEADRARRKLRLTADDYARLCGRRDAGGVDGAAAVWEIVEANLGLAGKFAKAARGRGVSYDDLVQAGTLGLHHAARKYRPELGFKFSTYGSRWVRQFIRREIDASSWPVGLPTWIWTAIVRFNRAALAAASRGEPTDFATIAATLDLDPNHCSCLAAALTTLGRKVFAVGPRQSKIPRGGAPIEGEIADAASADPVLGAEAAEDRATLRAALDSLDPAAADVLRRFYGLGTPAESKAGIGRALGLTRERIRQLVVKAEDSFTVSFSRRRRAS